MTVQSHSSFDPASIPNDAIGATIVYDDPGVWGFVPPQNREATILSIEPSRHHRRYFLVQAVGINLPRRIVEAQIVAYTPAVTPVAVLA